jgi:hypothetical protein
MRIACWTALAAAVILATTAHAAITISTHKTRDESCSGGVCTPTGPNPNIRVKDLEKLLSHSDMTIVTGQGSTGIGVLDPLSWTSSHRLTLDANQSIHVRAPLVVEGTGAVTLITNDGGTGGDYTFDAPGAINFWDTASSLVVNGMSFTLVKDIQTLAGDIAANPSGNYALAGSYDASADGAYITSPIPTVFTGVFEGLGNSILNFTVSGTSRKPQYAGLFAQASGTLRDIALNNVNISLGENSQGLYTGTLAVFNKGLIANATATGTIFIDKVESVGGLVYENDGTITDASTSIAFDAYFAGGLAEKNNGTITLSRANGSFTAGWAGGLVFFNTSTGIISWSSASGSVTGRGGGLASENDGMIAGSYSSVALSAATPAEGPVPDGESPGNRGRGQAGFTSGLVAYNRGGTILQSYAIGAVQLQGADGEKGGAGGLVGENDRHGAIAESYSTGTVTSNLRDVGGLIGVDTVAGNKRADYWNLDTSGISDPHRGAGHPLDDPGITGLTDAQLKSALPDGFDPAVWGQDPAINNGWPYLLANPPQ